MPSSNAILFSECFCDNYWPISPEDDFSEREDFEILGLDGSVQISPPDDKSLLRIEDTSSPDDESLIGDVHDVDAIDVAIGNMRELRLQVDGCKDGATILALLDRYASSAIMTPADEAAFG